jgi:uncharacterized protein YecT (DUF1311 family)
MRFSIMAALALCAAAGGAFAADAPLYKARDCDKEMVQMEMNMCAGANLEAASAELNRAYQKTMTQQTDQTSKDQLKDAERAWIAYRDKECAWEIGPQEDGGSIWPMAMDNCLQEKTDARIRELKSQLDCSEGDVTCKK